MLLLSGITIAATGQALDPLPMATTPATQFENNAYWYNRSQNGYYNEMYRASWVWDVRSMSWVKRVELITPAPNTPLTNPPVLYNTTGTPYQSTYESNPARNTNTIKTGTRPGGQ